MIFFSRLVISAHEGYPNLWSVLFTRGLSYNLIRAYAGETPHDVPESYHRDIDYIIEALKVFEDPE